MNKNLCRCLACALALWLLTGCGKAPEPAPSSAPAATREASAVPETSGETTTQTEPAAQSSPTTEADNMRIGHGYDVHRLVPGRDLILGGVKLEYPLGLDGHSDADVLTHAVMDALLGAAGLGDIGRHFPDTDPAYKGIDSQKLLAYVRNLLKEKGFRVGNIDVTVIAQAPKLAPHIPQMRENLAATLAVEASRINVKATTEERLGFTGRGEGIACHAVCLLEGTTL